MPTFSGWTVITMPSTPAPKSCEFTRAYAAAVSVSPFTFQQQIQDWGAATLECSVTMPPMSQADAQAWVNFLIACKGQVNVFQIANTVFAALVPSSASATGYWRLKTNGAKWSINEGIIYGLHFDMKEAK